MLLLLKEPLPFWEISIGFAALIAFALYIFFNSEFEECVCATCGWEGPEKDLDSFSTEDQKLWFHFCPKCDSNKIIYTKKQKP